jgi:hypothetical protein
MISWLTPGFRVGISAAGPPIAGNAPLASDNAAAPNIGPAFRRRFRFEACFGSDMA